MKKMQMSNILIISYFVQRQKYFILSDKNWYDFANNYFCRLE